MGSCRQFGRGVAPAILVGVVTKVLLVTDRRLMGYQITKRYTRPDGSIVWRIIYETYTDAKKTQRHVPKEEWPTIGFSTSMTFKEAKERAKQLSSQDWVKFQERRRNAIQQKLKKEEKIECAWL